MFRHRAFKQLLLLTLALFTTPHWAAPASIVDQIANMTLAEKIGQLLMVHFHGNTANEAARELIQDLQVGGIIYYNWANDLSTPAKVQALGASLQALARTTRLQIPLFIAADQEGGLVERCPITKFPGNKTLGLTQDPALAAASAQAIGTELAAINVNTNLAPVVDVNNPGNPVIGIRSYGDTPELVTEFGTQALQGYHAAGIITTLKHFPGHGDTLTDSHYAQPVVSKSLAELERVDLYPFVQLADQADMIMTAHINVPALDPQQCVTLSAPAIDYLRHKIGFQGVIITDSLVMEGVLIAARKLIPATKVTLPTTALATVATTDIPTNLTLAEAVSQAAIGALQVGHDLILLGGAQLHGTQITKELTLAGMRYVQQQLIQAVQTGKIPLVQIDQAVTRVLTLKQKYLVTPPTCANLLELVNTPAHQALALKITQAAQSSSNSR